MKHTNTEQPENNSELYKLCHWRTNNIVYYLKEQRFREGDLWLNNSILIIDNLWTACTKERGAFPHPPLWTITTIISLFFSPLGPWFKRRHQPSKPNKTDLWTFSAVLFLMPRFLWCVTDLKVRSGLQPLSQTRLPFVPWQITAEPLLSSPTLISPACQEKKELPYSQNALQTNWQPFHSHTHHFSKDQDRDRNC